MKKAKLEGGICLLSFSIKCKVTQVDTSGNSSVTRQIEWYKKARSVGWRTVHQPLYQLPEHSQTNPSKTTTTTCLLSCLQSVTLVSLSMLSLLPPWLKGSCRVPSLQSKIRNLVSYFPPTESPMFPPLLTSIYDLATHLSRWGDPIPLLFSIHKSSPALWPASSQNNLTCSSHFSTGLTEGR